MWEVWCKGYVGCRWLSILKPTNYVAYKYSELCVLDFMDVCCVEINIRNFNMYVSIQ